MAPIDHLPHHLPDFRLTVILVSYDHILYSFFHSAITFVFLDPRTFSNFFLESYFIHTLLVAPIRMLRMEPGRYE